MESVPRFFLLDRLVERSAGRRSVREHAGRSPDCVARMRRRLRSFGVAERSKRKAGGAARLSAAPSPGPAAPGMAGHVPLSESSRREAEGPSPPARDAPGRVGSGGFGAGHPQGFDAPADGSVKTDRPLRSPWSDCGCRIRRHPRAARPPHSRPNSPAGPAAASPFRRT